MQNLKLLLFLSSSYQLFCLQIIELIVKIISCSPKFRVTSCKKYKSGSTFSGKKICILDTFILNHAQPCVTELLMGGNVSSVDECYFSLENPYIPPAAFGVCSGNAECSYICL